MNIEKVNIENYKCFYGKFSIEFNQGINILVGDNEAGKSTILEAINLALTGILGGRYLKNELSQYLFNRKIVSQYILGIKHGDNPTPPQIVIEVFWLFGISHGTAIYGGAPIRQTCDSLQGQGRDAETKLCFGEYHNNVALSF